MSIEGSFKIEVKARPMDRARAQAFKNICSSYVQAMDKNYKLDENYFADISVILTWSGVPKRFQDSQLLLKFLDSKIKEYMIAWELTFNLRMRESEG